MKQHFITLINKKELPENWGTALLEEISDIGAGNPAPQGEQYFKNGIYPFVRVQDMGRLGTNKYIASTADYINQSATKKMKLFQKGAVLFTKSGASSLLNQRAILRSDMYVVSHIAVANPREGISGEYLYYWLKIIDFNHIAHATTLPSIPLSKVNQISVSVASTAEQLQIVNVIEQLFSDLDNAIDNLKKAKDQLKAYRQTVLIHAFEGKLANISNIDWISLGDVCHNVEYGTSAKSQKQGMVPVLRMGNIQNGKFDWSDLVYTNNKQEIEKYELFNDDVLFNRTNSPEWVGKTAIYKGKRLAIFAGYLIRVNYDKDKVNGDYLNYFLNSHIARKHGDKVKSFGVNQSNINGTKLKKYPFPITSINNQKKIVNEIESRFSVSEKMEETIENSLNQAEALRQSILKQAFEGKLTEAWRKKHPEFISGKNSAKALLEKIKADREALSNTQKRKK